MNKRFHHVGIPTSEPQPGERYSEKFKMYTSGGDAPTRIQYHRFETGCPLHPLIQTRPHVAFVVDDLLTAIKDKEIILEPYQPFTGFHVAFTNENGWPVEYIQTELSNEMTWDEDNYKNSVIYPKG